MNTFLHTPRCALRAPVRAARWLLLASAAALAACAGVTPAAAPNTPPQNSEQTTEKTAEQTAAETAVQKTSRAAAVARLHTLLPTDVLLLGEQHDAPEHQRLQREVVQALAARGQLAALVMEMAERGRSTADLPRGASEAQAQAALQWSDQAWPWQAYGPVVMAAVSAGVPVLGGNLPRADMRAAMAQTKWDQHLPAPALQWQYAALREGHCGLLPESQIAPMARIQLARDASMAQTVQSAVRPQQTVVLVAGGGHVLRTVGVPTHWGKNLVSKVVLAQSNQAQAAIKTEAFTADATDTDLVVDTPALPERDVCAPLRAMQKQ